MTPRNGSSIAFRAPKSRARLVRIDLDSAIRDGDGENEPRFIVTRAVKVKFWNKLQAIEAIAKLAGYTREESKVGGEVVVRWSTDADASGVDFVMHYHGGRNHKDWTTS